MFLSLQFSSQAQLVGWDGSRNGLPPGFQFLPSTALDSEFVSYSFPSGLRMAYDQSYKVTITMKNTGSSTWSPGEVSLVQDDNDINWRPSTTAIPVYVSYNRTVDITFFVRPRPCFLFGALPCYQTNFNWQLSKNGVHFGAVTPNAQLDVRRNVQTPTTPPNPNYGGMILTPPSGPVPTVIPDTSFPTQY